MTAQRIALLSPAIGTDNIGDHFIERAITRLLGEDLEYVRFSTRTAPGEQDLAAINACDCALLCGTNLYQRDWHSELTPDHLARMEVPVIPFGVGSSAAGLGDVRVGPQSAAMIRGLHATCAAGGIRDPFTMEVLAELDVANGMLTGCPVLFWSGAPELPLPDSRTRNRLVVTARNWLMHRWPDAVDHPVQVEFLRRILAAFPDHEVVFAIHEDFDVSLIDTLGLDPGQVLQSRDPDEFISLYTDPDNVVLAMRLHAGMLATANAVPAVFVGHDTRTYSFCQMLGLEWVELFDDHAADDAIRRLRAALDGDVALPAATAPTYSRLRESMTRFLEVNELPVIAAAPSVKAAR
jgi:hypothetical protein